MFKSICIQEKKSEIAVIPNNNLKNIFNVNHKTKLMVL